LNLDTLIEKKLDLDQHEMEADPVYILYVLRSRYLMKLAPLVSVVRSRTTSAGARIPFSMTTMSPTLSAELATLTSPRSVSFKYLTQAKSEVYELMIAGR